MYKNANLLASDYIQKEIDQYIATSIIEQLTMCSTILVVHKKIV